MADVFSVTGDVFLSPLTATSGGVKLPGLDPRRPLRLVAPHGMVVERHGYERDAVNSYQIPAHEPVQLVIPAAGGDAETLKLLFASMTEDGEAIQSAGGNALKAASLARAVSAVVRPRDASRMFWYFPALQLNDDSLAVMNRSYVDLSEIDESLLSLLCGKPIGVDVDAAFIGTPSAINAHYGLGSQAPLITLTPGYVDLGETAEGEAGGTVFYRLQGRFLTDDISIGAVSGVEYSLAAGGPFSSTLSVTPVGGIVNRRIYVRFSDDALEGTVLVHAAHSSPGATTKHLVLIGVVTEGGDE